MLELAALLIYCGFLVAIAIIDLKQKRIPDKVTYSGMAVVLAFTFLLRPVPHALIGAGVGFAGMAVLSALSSGGLGWGDVKLAALVGLMVGFPMVVTVLVAAWIAGGIVAAVLLWKKRDGQALLPFGPWLATATAVSLVWALGYVS